MAQTDYYEKYCEDIERGILSGFCTNGNGEVLGLDEGLGIWAGRSDEVKRRGGLFFLCGNGASATIAEHLSHDCFQNADFLTQTCSETSHITAVSNDLSYEDVFAYRVGKQLKKGDMLITISSSGNSPNILKAIRAARKKGAFIVTLSGKGADNQSRKLGDLNFYIPLSTYGMVESAHALLMHMWLDYYMDKYMEGRH